MNAEDEDMGQWLGRKRIGDGARVLRNFVLDQLHGPQITKNQEILLQFQRQAEERKHRRRQQIFPLINSALIPDSPANRLSNYGRYNSIEVPHTRKRQIWPTSRSPPPIINRKSIYNDGKSLYQPQQRYRRQAHSTQIHRQSKIQRKSGTNTPHYSRLIMPQSPYHTLADQDAQSTGSDQLIEEIEYRMKKAQREASHLQKQLKKLKKYKRYVRGSSKLYTYSQAVA